MPSANRRDENGGKLAHWVLIIIVLVVGCGLRVYDLGAQSLGNDELSSWRQSNVATLTDVIQQGVRPDVHPPGYQLMLYYVEHHIGDSEADLRLPSMIAGTAAIFAIFLLGQSLYSRREGLVAAALLAVSWTPLAMSQNARAYSLLLLFSIVTFHLWYRLLRMLQAEETPGILVQTLYVLSAVATCYLHYFGLLLVALQGVTIFAYLLDRPAALIRIVALYALLALSYVPWLSVMLEHLSRSQTWITRPTLGSALWQFWTMAFPGFRPISWFIGALLLMAAARTILHRARSSAELSLRQSFHTPTTIVIGWATLPFAVAYWKSVTSTPVLTGQNLIISLPALYLLVARALSMTFARTALQSVTAIALVLAIGWSVLVRGGYYSIPRDTQFREAVQFVVKPPLSIDEDSPIIGCVWNGEFLNYYLQKLGSRDRVALVACADDDIEELVHFLNQKNPRQVWLLSAHRAPTANLLRSFDALYDQVAHRGFKDASANLYQRK